MLKRIIQLFLVLTLISLSAPLQAQDFGIKTNLLYWGTATPNIGAEMAIGQKSTIDLQMGYNPWNLNGSETNNKKIAHWAIQPEYRYWFCEKFMGHFVGAHPFYAEYNISGYKIPLLLESSAKNHRYKGNMYGVGVSYGYQLALSRYFNMEFTLGVGYARMNYDKYACTRCGDKLGNESRNYLGPTRVGVSLMYIFNK